MANRVLPTPPGPVRESRRTSDRSSSSDTAITPWRRPMKVVSGMGRSYRDERSESTGEPITFIDQIVVHHGHLAADRQEAKDGDMPPLHTVQPSITAAGRNR